METEMLVAIFTGVFAGLGILARLSFQIGRFIQRVEFIEVRQDALDKTLDGLDTRIDIVEEKLPLMVIRGSKK